MRILIVDGWTNEGNEQHNTAGCETQAEVFDKLINQTIPHVKTTIVNTDSPDNLSMLNLTQFNAAIWTGGGGNIYEKNSFNTKQLALGEDVLSKIPYFWGSCWGLQVATTVLGGQVSPAKTPEIGIASNIVVKTSPLSKTVFNKKPGIFDAPAHHGDEVTRLPSEFVVLAENDITVQAVAANEGKIVCTQYHPEIPYNYLKKLLIHWAPNYKNLFSDQEFTALLDQLSEKEQKEGDMRQIELLNWLDLVQQDAETIT